MMKKITLIAAIFAVFTMNAQDVILEEAFDDATTLEGAGWTFSNASDMADAAAIWRQGADNIFESQEGEPTAYLLANFQSTTGNAATGFTISNWAATPTLMLQDGDELTFFTRSTTGQDGTTVFPDRLEVRLSSDGDDSELPTTSDEVGTYETLLLEINPDLNTTDYPLDWQEFTVTISGLTDETAARVAFRYFVTDGGPGGNNSNAVGVDTLTITDNTLSLDDNNIAGFTQFLDTNSNLNLRANVTLENVALFNIVGQQVVNKSLSSNNETVNLSDLNAGVYIARVSVAGQTETFKIVKR
ncbi:T9SS C-terminal target domain-containing protein [Dokdonia sinensis]|uniref:T9SS C-terminal target domain-containing protein n=1 Tax=Dokdonia sinensis TaxID=2479847 RepID=A0A3M0FVC4_9FLAO|nr:choice-of-anchor J domain-containing protein [Dokdonia sinensis]RMB56621.1 T9SS C-terminal target domain-containing protein [Dokdonia sinensis]